jgi:ligand-binding SRPBCC domain-containing protein
MAHTFHASTKLAATAETMFAFHSDPHNLDHVMPPTMKVTKLITEFPAREGENIEDRAATALAGGRNDRRAVCGVCA